MTLNIKDNSKSWTVSARSECCCRKCSQGEKNSCLTSTILTFQRSYICQMWIFKEISEIPLMSRSTNLGLPLREKKVNKSHALQISLSSYNFGGKWISYFIFNAIIDYLKTSWNCIRLDLTTPENHTNPTEKPFTMHVGSNSNKQ